MLDSHKYIYKMCTLKYITKEFHVKSESTSTKIKYTKMLVVYFPKKYSFGILHQRGIVLNISKRMQNKNKTNEGINLID